jgi:hypothetical protein
MKYSIKEVIIVIIIPITIAANKNNLTWVRLKTVNTFSECLLVMSTASPCSEGRSTQGTAAICSVRTHTRLHNLISNIRHHISGYSSQKSCGQFRELPHSEKHRHFYRLHGSQPYHHL